MAETLTPQQKEAVFNRGGNLLVSAAAGSGKTKVLVDRLLSYLKDPVRPANIDDFLLITYTKAAASELRGKIAAKLTEAVAAEPENRHMQQQLQRLYLTKISTVHAFCGDLLREYAYRLDISGDFRVADETECQQLQDRVMEELLEEAYVKIDEDPYFRAFIDTQGLGRDDRQIPELILKVYNSARCHLHPDQWLDWCLSSGNTEGIRDASDTIWGSYLIEELKQYAALQIRSIETCARKAEITDGMEKPAVLLRDTLAQLKSLIAMNGWDEIRSGLNIDFGRLTFPKKCGDPLLAEQIKSVRNACKKGLEKRSRRFADESKQILQDICSVTDSAHGLVDLVKKFSAAYDKMKRGYRILDFGDLEHRTLDLLLGKNRGGPTALAGEIGERFREVMVDEYQDSNAVQDAIFSAITHKRNNCFMVGDVKQSIYQFRLADPDIFLDKYHRYGHASEAADGFGRKVMLSSNFRSGGGVISAVNDVFSACMSPKVGGLRYGAEEALYEGLPHEPIGEPEVELYGITVGEDTYAEEAAFVSERICALTDGKHMVRGSNGLRPIIPEDIVVLLRSPGSVGNDFRRALEDRGIPCVMGGSLDLLQTEEVSVLHALLQIIDNPLQDIPMIAVLTSRLFCFRADELAELRADNKKCDIYTSMKASENAKVQDFLALLYELRSASRMLKLTEIISYVFLRTGIDSIYASMSDGAQRTENLQAFCRFAGTSEANGIADIPRFLEQLDSASERGLTVQGDESAEGAVTIMSIHKSKGLEFPVVFLCGLSREFNRESMRAAVLCDKELGIGLSCVDAANRIRYPSLVKTAIAIKMQHESVSEEMRVLYVAMTRARDRLIMTYASRSLESDLTELSQRMELSDTELITSEADCPGCWVLLSALQRTEAGAFFALTGAVPSASVRDPAWLIRVVEAPECVQRRRRQENSQSVPAGLVERLREHLAFRYEHPEATQTPSKQTATQLKGREKDREAAEFAGTVHTPARTWRKPSFIQLEKNSMRYGSAIHAVMQHIDLRACGSFEAIQGELNRLCEKGIVAAEFVDEAVCRKITAFFTSEMGKRICNCGKILREFKFSVLVDGEQYADGLKGEEILLQGVVDFALLEPDGITVLDYKTDRAAETDLPRLTEKYSAQVRAYAEALSRIYKLPVKAMLIYFFSAGMFAEIT